MVDSMRGPSLTASGLVVLGLLASAAPALEYQGPEAWLRVCGIDGLIYRHTELSYAATRVDWSFMSIDGDFSESMPAECSQPQAAALRLIAETYPQLERELARGDGLYTRSVLQQLGCDPEQSELVLHSARARLPAALAERPDSTDGRADLTLWYLGLLADDAGWPCHD